MNKKLLTICIPTYNRSEYVINQLSFVLKELKSINNLIDVKVSDNFSDMKHREKLIYFHKNNPQFELFLNKKNLGLIGNFYSLLQKVNSEYVWFLGDDDVLIDGVLDVVIKNIKLKNVNYVFMNYKSFYDNISNSFSTINLMGLSGFVQNNNTFAVDFFNKNKTSCMFMSAGIYRTELLKPLLNINRKSRITDPLLFFFLSSIDNVYIEDKVYVLDKLSDTTWKKESLSVFTWMVPYTILELLKISNYKKSNVICMVKNYYLHEKNYLIMIFRSPFKIKIEIISMMGKHNILLMHKSFLFLVSVIINKFLKIK
ncbi:glycosyltransferase [Flavobacterium bomense]|uniref:Glycosyltransferase n=1 Tax=Flavobacterium bomense TaxID=2497483 RepID=A0A3S0P169_9FLAO|nr:MULTISPECIES: glycosyltransferase [Flavobacterium]RTY66263.1 glycosyltransferase [Flavobacterium sp. LB2P53]RTZ05509.1 glycosyltransferase [Flavobacterium bomense]